MTWTPVNGEGSGRQEPDASYLQERAIGKRTALLRTPAAMLRPKKKNLLRVAHKTEAKLGLTYLIFK